MCQWSLRSHVYRPCLWAGGQGWFSTCACPCLATGPQILQVALVKHVMLKQMSRMKNPVPYTVECSVLFFVCSVIKMIELHTLHRSGRICLGC
jgi:hypothetical protein